MSTRWISRSTPAGQLAAVETITADFQRPPRLNYAWDVGQTRTIRGWSASSLRSCRSNLTVICAIPVAVGRRQALPGRQDRRSVRDADYGSHVFEIRYTIPGVLIRPDRATSSSRRRRANPTPCPPSTGTPLRRRGTTLMAARTSRSRCPPRSPNAASCLASAKRASDSTVVDNTVRLTAMDLPPRTPGQRARGRRHRDACAGHPAVAIHPGPDPRSDRLPPSCG